MALISYTKETTKRASAHLHAGETVSAAALCRPRGGLAARFPRGGDVVLAVTDRRVLAFRPANVYEIAAEFSPADITRIAFGGGLLMRNMQLMFSDGSVVRLSLPRGQGDVTALRASIIHVKEALQRGMVAEDGQSTQG